MRSRAAVIGAGPSGFYATEQLLAAEFDVDLFDALPTPFGLVRAGVAPDHPKIKAVTRVYERTAAHPAFRFYGGVELGADVTREELLDRYHAVVYAVGTQEDRRLGIPGEDLRGVVAATELVAWYNGHPAFADHDVDLSCSRAIVIGNGNVAIDIARMLVLSADELAPTDTADHALARLAASSVREVTILGRRGPAQAAFTNPELRELGELRRADVVVDPSDLELDEHSAAWLESGAASPTARRNVDILRGFAGRAASGATHRIGLRFFSSPVEIVGDGTGAVRGLRVARNRPVRDRRGGVQAVATDRVELLECGLVVRAIGYRGRALAGVPFDGHRGRIPNQGGRVVDSDGERRVGEYVAGWIKRGPSGVIGTNKKDAAETTTAILADRDAGALNMPAGATDRRAVDDWLHARVPGLVTWTGWQAIDAHERSAGEPLGRPRVKVVHVPEMAAIARRSTA